MESLYYGLTLLDVRRMAYQLATRNHIKHQIARDWINAFINRRKHMVSGLKPTGTSYSRVRGFSKNTTPGNHLGMCIEK